MKLIILSKDPIKLNNTEVKWDTTIRKCDQRTPPHKIRQNKSIVSERD
jgi:hypothetical protein